MKKILRKTILFSFCLLPSAFLLQAQAPEKLSYQAVIRNAGNVLVTNQPVGMRLSILQGSATGNTVYAETHTSNTNGIGLLSLEIGGGSVVSGSFSSIDWAAGPYFIKTETDPEGGTAYSITGTSQLLSAPYALYAKTSGSSIPGPQGPAGPAGNGGFVHYVGEQFGGGVVFHVYRDASGTERGLVVSKENLGNNQGFGQWSNIIDAESGALSPWDGLANSNAIINQTGHSSSAAKFCMDYEINGTNDWYLPSIDELNLLVNTLYPVNKSFSTITGAVPIEFSNTGIGYFSSSEDIYGGGETIRAVDVQGPTSLGKNSSAFIRAIRAFSVPSNSGSVTDVDGNTYETVTIGSQVWMKENLKVSKYRNGDAIPTGLSNSAWQNATSGASAIYDNTAVNDSIYGKLYNWYAVADPRGLCPAGWHVPSDGEWKTLESYLGMTSSELDNTGSRGGAQNVGGKLKSISSLWQSPNTGATNAVEFSALPGAYRNIDGPFYGLGVDAVWWSSSLNGTTKAWSRLLTKGDGNSARFDYHLKSYGFSIRCLKD